MLGQTHGHGGWMRGALALLAALAVAWAMLAGSALATPSGDASTSMQACCPHAAAMADGSMSDAMTMDHPCDSEMGCPSPDCAMTAGSIATGTLSGLQLALREPGLESRSRLTSSRPRNFALPIPKQPPRI